MQIRPTVRMISHQSGPEARENFVANDLAVSPSSRNPFLPCSRVLNWPSGKSAGAQSLPGRVGREFQFQ